MKNKRDQDLLHISVVSSMKAPVGFEIWGGYECMDPSNGGNVGDE
jgi:hypothetical protein